MDRRTFVKGCVAVAGTAGTLAAGYSMAAPLAIPRKAGTEIVRYLGAHRVDGPAPRGVPLIPIRKLADGTFEGPPDVQSPGGKSVHILDWYKYCQHQGAPGLRKDYPGDNKLRYFIAEEKIAIVNPWYKDLIGKEIRADDFPDYEFGANFAWRSEGADGINLITGILVKHKPDEYRFPTGGRLVSPAKPLNEDEIALAKQEFITEDGFVAVSSYCPHFCCTPGWKEAKALAEPKRAWDKVFCTCHNSVYNARQIVAYDYIPEPVGSDVASAGGGH